MDLEHLIATTTSEGAEKWTSDLDRWFAGRTVYVLAYNDQVGRKHARQVADNLTGVAAERGETRALSRNLFDWSDRYAATIDDVVGLRCRSAVNRWRDDRPRAGRTA